VFPGSATDRIKISASFSIVKNYSECVPASGTQATHTVPEVHAVNTLLTLNRTMMNGKHDAVTLSKRHNYRPRLHARPLFSHHKLAASEISIRF
jgi:hypothetical protein